MKLILFMQQQCNKLIKGGSKDIYIVTKIFIFQINAGLLNFQFIKELKKIKLVTKYVFNIKNNNKMNAY